MILRGSGWGWGLAGRPRASCSDYTLHETMWACDLRDARQVALGRGGVLRAHARACDSAKVPSWKERMWEESVRRPGGRDASAALPLTVYRFVRILANDELISDQGYGGSLSTASPPEHDPAPGSAPNPDFVWGSQKPKPTTGLMDRLYD